MTTATKTKTADKTADKNEPKTLTDLTAGELRNVAAALLPEIPFSAIVGMNRDKLTRQLCTLLAEGVTEKGTKPNDALKLLFELLGEKVSKAKRRERFAEVASATLKKAKGKTKKSGRSKATKESTLTITKPVNVFLKRGEKEFKGKLLVNGKVVMDDMDGECSPAKAMQTLLNVRNSPWQLFLYKNSKGEFATIDGLRRNPKGFEVFELTRTNSPRRTSGEKAVDRLTAKIERLEKQLAEAREGLVEANVLKTSEEILKTDAKWIKRGEKLTAMKAPELLDLVAAKTGETKASFKDTEWAEVVRQILLVEVRKVAVKANG